MHGKHVADMSCSSLGEGLVVIGCNAIPDLCAELLEARAEVQRLRALVTELRDALVPFVKMADDYTDLPDSFVTTMSAQVTVDHLRRAATLVDSSSTALSLTKRS
jgi:hypothetical protein